MHTVKNGYFDHPQRGLVIKFCQKGNTVGNPKAATASISAPEAMGRLDTNLDLWWPIGWFGMNWEFKHEGEKISFETSIVQRRENNYGEFDYPIPE